MKTFIFLLLFPSLALAARDSIKCGKVVAARIDASAENGGGEIKLPKDCPRIDVFAPYSVAYTSLGQVIVDQTGIIIATFLSAPGQEQKPTQVTVQVLDKRPQVQAPVVKSKYRKAPTTSVGYHKTVIDLNGRHISALVED